MKKFLVIYNPMAGAKKIVNAEVVIKRILKKEGHSYDFFETILENEKIQHSLMMGRAHRKAGYSPRIIEGWSIEQTIAYMYGHLRGKGSGFDKNHFPDTEGGAIEGVAFDPRRSEIDLI